MLIVMAPFSLTCANGGVLSTARSSLHCPSSILNGRISRVDVRKRILTLREEHRDISASFSISCCDSQLRLLRSSWRSTRFILQCNKTVLGKIDGGSVNEKHTHFGIKGGNPNSKRRLLSLRLRPRLRLLSYGLKRISVQQLVENVRTLLHKNSKKLTLYSRVAVVLGLCFVFLKCTAKPASLEVPYSEFVSSLQNGAVSAVQFEEDSRYIYFNKHSVKEESLKLTEKDTAMAVEVSGASTSKSDESITKARERKGSSTPKWRYSTRKINHDESFLLGLMREKGAAYSSAPLSAVMLLRSLIITLITLWIPLAPLMWLLYRQFYASNSPAKKRRPSKQSVTFDDVEGVDAAKQELVEIVSCLRGSIDYKKLGAKLPRGVLLVGPPGTGKTLLARSVAGEAGVPFFSVSASEFVELFVGRGAARVRDLFSVAKECAPSIIFIDELDAVGGKRGRSFNDERDQTLNQLLTEMDGFESDTKVIVVAATNRPEALDPALCRPGRFSRKVLVGEPDFEGRKKILVVHLRQVPLEEETEIICDLVSSLTAGLVGADLANIVNEAALLAARRGGERVSREDIMEAIERTKFGIKERRLTPISISRGLVKLFPWMNTSRTGMGKDGLDGLQGLMGYQTLS